MKTQILLTIAKALGVVIGSYALVVGMAFGFREWVVMEAVAVADQKIEVVKEIRKADMEHIDQRFDRLERKQDTNFRKLERVLLKEIK